MTHDSCLPLSCLLHPAAFKSFTILHACLERHKLTNSAYDSKKAQTISLFSSFFRRLTLNPSSYTTFTLNQCSPKSSERSNSTALPLIRLSVSALTMNLLLISAVLLLWVKETSSQDIMAPSVNILTELKSIKERLKSMEVEIHELQRENREQAIQLETLNASRCRTEEPLLTDRREDIRVAFSAFLLNSTGPTNVGPFGSTTTLIYKHIFLNIGEGYNPNTGIFTAPLKGAYVFRVFSKGVGKTPNAMTAGLFKNGLHVFSTHAYQSGGFYSSSNGASLPLEKGDTVSVRLYAGTWIFDNGEHHHSSFSGHLLFPL